MSTNDTKRDGAAFAKFLANMPPELREKGNEANRKEAAAQHAEFKEAFKNGRCSFCGDALTSFDAEKPCRHWLLKPEGFRKKHFETLAKLHTLSVFENYLRWVANEEAFAQNINDLADEGTGKLVELTIKYRNLQWSFSCSETDLGGHETESPESKQPHYHFQMYVDGQPFIRFNDFHLPLNAPDVGFLEYKRTNPGKVKSRVHGGAGMSEVLQESNLETLIKAVRSGESEEDEANAPIKLDTMIFARPGETISGDEVYRLIQEAKAEGVTITSKLRNLKNTTVQTIVTPGPGVVEQAPRSGRKKRGDNLLRQQAREWREKQKRET